MSDASVTPGPWHWVFEDASVMALYGPDDERDFVLWSGICPACQKRGGRCTAPNDANADLIAKAPELLAENKLLRAKLRDLGYSDKVSPPGTESAP